MHNSRPNPIYPSSWQFKDLGSGRPPSRLSAQDRFLHSGKGRFRSSSKVCVNYPVSSNHHGIPRSNEWPRCRVARSFGGTNDALKCPSANESEGMEVCKSNVASPSRLPASHPTLRYCTLSYVQEQSCASVFRNPDPIRLSLRDVFIYHFSQHACNPVSFSHEANS
jgi:hypothetical protein